MKVLFITINSLDNYAGIPKWRYSLAFAYLQSFYSLSPNYAKTEFVNEVRTLNSSDAEISELVLKHSPDIVCFSCYVWNTAKTLGIISEIKKKRPGIVLLLGGPECTSDLVKTFAPGPVFDIMIKGEGEKPFRIILDELHRSGKLPLSMNGIIYYNRDSGGFSENPGEPPLEDINAVPSPYLNGIIQLNDIAGSIIGIETQRGCAFHCGYCNYTKGYKTIRYFDIDRIISELDLIMSHKPKQLYLMDPMFNSDKNRAKKILRYIAEKNRDKKTIVSTEMLLDTMDEELLETAAEAGVATIEVGIQTFNPRALKYLNRFRNEKNLIANLASGLKHGLNLVPQLIYGLPGDTVADFYDSFDRMYAFDMKEFDIFRLLILPGTEFRKKAVEYGLVFDRLPPYEIRHTAQITEEEADRLDLFRKLALCAMWHKEIVSRICELRKTAYHELFASFISANEEILKELFFDWPVHSRKDAENAVKVTALFSGHLRSLPISDAREKAALEEKLAQADNYARKIFLFRSLSLE